jgi:hypothetical protein
MFLAFIVLETRLDYDLNDPSLARVGRTAFPPSRFGIAHM